MAFTKLYLTNTAAIYTPATLRGAWDDTAAVVTKSLDPGKISGGVTTVSEGETSASPTFDVLLYRGVSEGLAAQTISGTLDVTIGVMESIFSPDSDMYWHVYVYVTQGNSDTPRGVILSDYTENTTNEWSAGASVIGTALQSPQTLSPLAIQDGDRIVIELGFIARNSLTSNRSGTLRYGTIDSNGSALADASIGGSTTAASFITFSNSITELAITDRVSQLVMETLTAETSAVRSSQLVVEVFADAGIGNQRTSQLVLELAEAQVPIERVTQLLIEYLNGLSPQSCFGPVSPCEPDETSVSICQVETPVLGTVC